MNQGAPDWADAGGDPKSWDAVSHHSPWRPLANRPGLATAKHLSRCDSWLVMVGVNEGNILVSQHFELGAERRSRPTVGPCALHFRT